MKQSCLLLCLLAFEIPYLFPNKSLIACAFHPLEFCLLPNISFRFYPSFNPKYGSKPFNKLPMDIKSKANPKRKKLD